MRNNPDEFGLFVELEKNIADESEAREGYYRLLSKYDYLLSDREIADFREIISEELKHTNLLNAMIRRRNGIIAEN
jgi:hypothetical protein